MYKELVISLIIVISIFVIDYIAQKYTDDAMNEITTDLASLQEELKEEEQDYDKVTKHVNSAHNRWLEHQDRMSFFIEHNELEKVETSFISGKSLIESQEYEEALSEIEKTIFILKHINEKYSFDMKNIF